MKRAPAVELTTAELSASQRAASVGLAADAPRGAWHGSAFAEVEHWRRRAIAAEADAARLKGELILARHVADVALAQAGER